MFADTLTVTINAVAKNLVRINQDRYSAEYFLRNSTEEFRMTIRHSEYVNKDTKKPTDRHNVELIHTVYPVSPATVPVIRKAYVVFENERADGSTDPLNFDLGFIGFFTNANITKLINWES